MKVKTSYPFAPQDIEALKHLPPAKARESGARRPPEGEQAKWSGRAASGEQHRLFRRIEAERDRIARVMLRYPKLLDAVMPALTERAHHDFSAKTLEWALALEDFLHTQCANPDSMSILEPWSARFREMLRIHQVDDTEMERFVAVLKNCVERLLLVEARFDVGANQCGLSPRAAVRLKEKDLGFEVLSPHQRETLVPWLEEIERIEKEVGASSEQMKEDLTAVLRSQRDLHSAKKDAVEANLRLVIRIARKYFHSGVPFEDLVQEGNLGLMRAVDKFDYRRGYKFSTYANWWIKQALNRAVHAQGHLIRLPFRLAQKAGKAKRSSSQKLLETGDSPHGEELAKDVGISPQELASILQTMTSRLVSMETPVMEGEAEMKDFIADPSTVSPEDAVIDKDMRLELRALLELLDPREKLILTERFGMSGEDEQSLRDLSRKFGVTPERIRQIEKKALQKIRRRLEARESYRAFADRSKLSN